LKKGNVLFETFVSEEEMFRAVSASECKNDTIKTDAFTENKYQTWYVLCEI